ncbi:amidohydrolase [Gottschalkiaceae bacterium SANA]|nr:amidohydrolase [Gottschalkiaceae bacterium SANA]
MKNEGSLYINGKVTCIRPKGLVHSAILTRGERIVAIGEKQALEALATFPYETVDLKGKMMLPGLIDTHAHFLDTGFSVTRLNLGEVKTMDELLNLLSKQAEKFVAGEWVMAVNFDENRIVEKRMPSLEELDEAVPNHPLYINHRGYHSSLLNSRAKQQASLPFEAEADQGGGAYISRGNNAVFKMWIAKQTEVADLDRAWAAASKIAVKRGLTTIHCIEGGEFWGDAYAEFLHRKNSNLLDLVLFYNIKRVKKIGELGLSRMGGDLFLDGSVSGRTAAFSKNYSDAETAGELYMADKELEQLIEDAHMAGIQISFHVIGDKAIEQALRVYGRVLKRHPARDHRHRIEHFGFPSDAQIARAAELGLAIATQPAFVYLKGDNYRVRLGEERVKNAYPLRKLLDAGLRVGGGSDSLVTPMDPLLGIHAAVNAPYENQRLSRMEAIEIYTIRAAELNFEEAEKGSLEAGKFADFVILQQDLFEVAEKNIKDVQVAMTVYHGRCVYQNIEEE